MIERILKQQVTKVLRQYGKSILLLGARQTGKSTLLNQLQPDLVINLADESTYRMHLKDVSLLKAQVEALPKRSVILVDEIQRIPSMLNTVQSLMDGANQYLFLLTGSSARKLKQGQVNLLPGRLFRYHLYPLTYWELKDQWDLDRTLQLGNLPEIYLKEYGSELLGQYVDSYLREEIQAEAVVRKVDVFARFLDLAAEVSGQMINYSELSSDSEIPKESLRRYFEILCDTLLAHRIRSFSDIKGNRKAVQKERILFVDVGVRNAVIHQQQNTFTSTQKGSLFEQWFIGQIIAYSHYHQKKWQVFYYRDDRQQEVDLVVDTGHKLVALEIKYGKVFKPKFLRHLQIFSKHANKKVDPILIYTGDLRQTREDVLVISYRDFLDEIESFMD